MQAELPAAAADLDDAQRAYLAALRPTLEDLEWSGEALQGAIFAVAKERGVPFGRAFAALYTAFLDRSSGPRAGWLLAALDRGFVLDRLSEAGAAVTA